MSNVIPLQRKPRQTRPNSMRPCPEHLSPEDLERLLRLAAKDGWTVEQVQYAWQQVKTWHATTGRLRVDWVLVTVNAMRRGWGTEGFEAWLRRRKGGDYRQRGLTEERIAALVERQRKGGD